MTLVLVDTSVWIEHLRSSSSTLRGLLRHSLVLTHAMVAGELALGDLAQRETFLHSLTALPQSASAMDEEILAFIERRRLYGRGLVYVDAHLLASTQLTPGAKLWTRDRRLASIASEVGVAFTPSSED